VELKRRNVYKVAVAYAVVGWLVIQIATATYASNRSQARVSWQFRASSLSVCFRHEEILVV